MPTVPVIIKHAGTKYDLQLDTSQPPLAFKQAIQQVTGITPDKQKVLVKGGQLKNDADWSKLAIKPNHAFMVIGTASSALPVAPPQPVVFVEDLPPSAVASLLPSPAGLDNLGNTCYMNSTLQVLRSVPELRSSLSAYTISGEAGGTPQQAALTASLRDLYKSLDASDSDSPVAPWGFLEALRRAAPQFAERSRSGQGYAQQDAEECWGTVVGALRGVLSTACGEGGVTEKFVERYLRGEMTTITKCTESPDEPIQTTTDPWLELKCNISINTNYMISGIKDALEGQRIEKRSEKLGRDAVWEQEGRISRLPAYLTVHMVRFYWRREISKKTKIMRKVKFPYDLDLVELLSSQLKSKILPVAERVKEVDRERRERAKIRGRRKVRREEEEREAKLAAVKAKATGVVGDAPMSIDPSTDTPIASQEDAEEDEPSLRLQERALLLSLAHPELLADEGCNFTGQYELVGIVTHKGASTDSGHYLGWVRKDVADHRGGLKEGEEVRIGGDPDKQEWYRFDDDKVAVVPREKILTLDGGGEDSVAYLLLYRSKPL